MDIINETDRLETVSLSQALTQPTPRISTGLSHLDAGLEGGLVRGQILEAYGCPGSGKTTFGMHIASRVIRHGQRVTWLECSQVLPASRLKEFLESSERLANDLEDDDEQDHDKIEAQMQLVTCFTTLTLSSLFGLLLHSQEDSGKSVVATEDTSLLVIDDLTTIYNAAFPPDNHKDTNTKKQRILSILSDCLTRLAITENIAILVLSKLTSKITKGGPAQLESPFGDAWSSHCTSRVVLYRDFYAKKLSLLDDEEIRWIAVQKATNRNILEPVGLPIKIVGSGIVTIDLEASQMARSQSQTSRPSSRQSTDTTVTTTPGREMLGKSRLRSSPLDVEDDNANKRLKTEQDDANDVLTDVEQEEASVADSEEE